MPKPVKKSPEAEHFHVLGLGIVMTYRADMSQQSSPPRLILVLVFATVFPKSRRDASRWPPLALRRRDGELADG